MRVKNFLIAQTKALPILSIMILGITYFMYVFIVHDDICQLGVLIPPRSSQFFLYLRFLAIVMSYGDTFLEVIQLKKNNQI
jgi:hypothetical protein